MPGKSVICASGFALSTTRRIAMPATLAMLVVMSATGSLSAPNEDPVLDFLMIGDLQGWPNHLGDDEPAIDITLVPARAFELGIPDEEVYRQSRIYFPRNWQTLLTYDVLFFNHPRLSFFTPQQQRMMVDFAGESGRVSIAYPLSTYAEVQIPWLNSPLSDVFPVNYEKFILASTKGILDDWWENRPLRLAPGLPPVFSVFEGTGIFGMRVYRTNRPCYATEGATIWLYMIDGPPTDVPEAPAFNSWPYGESDTWAFGVHPAGDRPHWEAAGPWWELIFLNVCIYTISGETLLFEEAVNKRSVKTQLMVFRESASMFHSIVDFVSKVGANTNEAESLLSEGHRVRTEAETDYLEHRYGEASEKMAEALALANRAMDEASRAKDRALTWVYVSEWMATTGVALISGMALWWLMVRRRLYRAVTTTQLRQR